MAELNVALDITFIDQPGDLDVGETLRFKVFRPAAVGQGQAIEISQLDFVFKPLSWGQVEATDDPFVGLLRVIELMETEDVYEEPDYAVSAMLKAQGATVLKPRRMSRLTTRRVEIELIFLHGYPGQFERFDPLTASLPLDVERSFRLESEGQQIVVRDGRIFLQCEGFPSMRTRVECKMPNGEVVACDLGTIIDSGVAWQPAEKEIFPRYEQRLAQQESAAQVPALVPVRIGGEDLASLRRGERLVPESAPVRIVDDPEVPLVIDFVDPPGDLIPGEEMRFKVKLAEQALEIRHLQFHFAPFIWATVEGTPDARIGRLRVLELPRSRDIYARPELSFDASLRARGGAPLRPRRMIRLVPGQVEVELVFFRGHGAQFELFNPLTAARPLDLHSGVVLGSDRQHVVERESRVYLQCDRLCDLRGGIAVTLPNGETLELNLASRIDSGALFGKDPEPVAAKPRPGPVRRVVEHETADDLQERALRERIKHLKTFILSFQTRRAQPDADTAAQIRERITSRVKQTKDVLKQYQGAREAEFLHLFQDALDQIPDYLRSPSAPLGAES